MARIHPTAIVDNKAEIAEDVTIGAYATVGPQVVIGEGCVVHSHAVISGDTRLGRNNQIFQFAAVGGQPQDKKYHGQEAKLIIGDNNIIREFTTINTGMTDHASPTMLGNNNFLMIYSHIAHNCRLHNDIVIVNNVQVAGHVEIFDGAVLGACSGVHQFVQIGERAMIAAYSAVLRDVPPAVMAGGQPARAFGLNRIGLRRLGFSAERINRIRENFRLVFQRGLAKEAILEELAAYPDHDSKALIEFLNNSKRGVIRTPPRNRTAQSTMED